MSRFGHNTIIQDSLGIAILRGIIKKPGVGLEVGVRLISQFEER
jgi:hypothetical protein